MAASVHFKCRNAQYAGGVERLPVPDDRVSWSVDWPEYKPVDYTAPSVEKGPVWADPEIRWGGYHTMSSPSLAMYMS